MPATDLKIHTREKEMDRVQDQAPALTAEEQQWIDDNAVEQKIRHENIVTEMEELSTQRDSWIDSFLERLQTRGFNYNCDFLRKVKKEELPEKPKRRFKVVF
jgi:hypothetical protein